MFDLSRPITIAGFGALLLYAIVCVTTGLAMFVLFLSYSYASSNPSQATAQAGVAAGEGYISLTQLAELSQGAKQPLQPHEILALTATAVNIAPTLTGDIPTPTFVVTNVSPSPTPDFAVLAEQATRSALEAGQSTVPATEQPTNPKETEMVTIIQKLFEDGIVGTVNGTYYDVPDYQDSWNQVDWYRWTYVEYPADNFVIKAKASWNTTSWGALSQHSGCGFVFRENNPENHYLMYLGINGRVYFYRMQNGQQYYIGNSVLYPVEAPAGQAEIMLVAYENRFYFYVNGDYLYDPRDGYFKSGKLGLTVLTGTAQDFGTECRMQDIALWVFE